MWSSTVEVKIFSVTNCNFGYIFGSCLLSYLTSTNSMVYALFLRAAWLSISECIIFDVYYQNYQGEKKKGFAENVVFC